MAAFDVAMTFIFTLELCVNAYGNWWKNFFMTPKNYLDIVVVGMSIFAVAAKNYDFTQEQSIRIAYKLVRPLRVLRIVDIDFFRTSKTFIAAMKSTLVPVGNAVYVWILVAIICE